MRDMRLFTQGYFVPKTNAWQEDVTFGNFCWGLFTAMGHDFLHAKLVGNRRYALFRQNSDLGAENHHFFDRPQLVVSAI